MNNDLMVFSHENLLQQAQESELQLGYHILSFYDFFISGMISLTFYVDAPGVPAKRITDATESFYLSPSGGTLRDSSMNIVMYSAKYDKYKGYGKA